MDYDKYSGMVEKTEPEDWSYDPESKTYTYNQNPSLSIIRDMVLPEYFLDWATNENRSPAYNVRFLIMVNNVKISEYYAIQVIRCNAYIPAPDSAGEKVITERDYKIGKILNISNPAAALDQSLEQLGITVCRP